MRRSMALVTLLVLSVAGAVFLASAEDKPASSVSPSSFGEPEYFAEQTADCGVELLNLARTESGPFEQVIPIGMNQPHERLRRNVWEWGRYKIRGHFTGKRREISGCSSFPEFEVLEFRPWGKVQRCASPGALDAVMQLYTGELPEERYAPEDFIDGPWPPSIDDRTCRLIAACATDMRRPESRHRSEDVVDGVGDPAREGRYCHPTACREHEKRIVSCAEDIWCCRTLPVDETPAQDAHPPGETLPP